MGFMGFGLEVMVDGL